MAWRQIGDKPFSQPMLTPFIDSCIYAVLEGDELKVFINFAIRDIFYFANVLPRSFISHSYSTYVTAAAGTPEQYECDIQKVTSILEF